jgi:SAM-dependent methyltransferase
MFLKDIEKVFELNEKYHFQAPLLDAGGLFNPTIANYEISKQKAVKVQYSFEGQTFSINAPHPIQDDRYAQISKPWNFIDNEYLILNPENGDPYIEDLPEKYGNKFSTVIMVSVLEHVDDPFKACEAIFKICKPGGYFFNSTPFMFPYHPSPNDNFRFSPNGLKIVHERSGFKVLECDFHLNYTSKDAVGDTNPANYGNIQPIMASFILCQKPF